MKVGYARVSLPEQKLDLQLDALKAAGCERIFSDHGISGTIASRPGLEDALSAIGAGDVLVVWKLDRLGRSVLHLANMLTRFHRDDIEFRSLSEGIDTTTMSGKLVFHIFSAVGEFERELIRERTVNGMAAAKARGKRLGRRHALSDLQVIAAYQRVTVGGLSIAHMARTLKVSHDTLSRGFKRMGLDV